MSSEHKTLSAKSRTFLNSRRVRRPLLLATAFAAIGLLAGCQDGDGLRSARALKPIPAETLALMSEKGMTKHSPILLRAFKKEAELEIWKMKANGEYALLKTYPMCRWSGQLGPKRREGDRQVPEGFYAITPARMNPNSAYYLSFDVGYPNSYDRAHGGTGSLIMVHGACSSAGCFSMTDEQIAEIYAIAREAFGGGQQAIQMHSMPFRMNAENLAKHRFDSNMPFWRMIKEGNDHFEVSRREPQVDVCGGKYVFNSRPKDASVRLDPRAACPTLDQDESLRAMVAQKAQRDSAQVAELVSKGTAAVKVVYADGGQHPSFRHVTVVSRPDAIDRGPTEIHIDEKGKPVKTPVQVATAKDQPAAGAAPAGAVAAPAATAIARTAPQQAAPAAAAPASATAFAPATPASQESVPFYRRLLGGATETAPTSAPATPPAAAAPSPAAAPPTPPRRAESDKSRKAAARDKQSDATPALIRGAAPALPADLMAFSPITR